jgi:hypothetical protein
MKCEVVEGCVYLALTNGNCVISGSDTYQAGDFVQVVDSNGEELGYWHFNEWQEDPQLVMGALLRCAVGEKKDESPAPPESDLWERFEKCFKPEMIDDHVHELKSAEAAGINNAGLEAQFDYLIDEAGADWVEQLITEEEQGA